MILSSCSADRCNSAAFRALIEGSGTAVAIPLVGEFLLGVSVSTSAWAGLLDLNVTNP